MVWSSCKGGDVSSNLRKSVIGDYRLFLIVGRDIFVFLYVYYKTLIKVHSMVYEIFFSFFS